MNKLPAGVYFSTLIKKNGDSIPFYAATWVDRGERKIRKFYCGDSSALSDEEARTAAIELRSLHPQKHGGKRLRNKKG